ncbi:MAG: DUF222 domain-containing protein [Ilumatobacteraceae bacterium]|nr:DUF222 domain-containing protein [Ilumatobacteraceae bacterium]
MVAIPTPAQALSALLPGDVGDLDASGAAAALGTVKSVRGFLDAYEANVTSHIRSLHAHGESAPAADLHTRNGGISSREARAKERRADALEQAPSLADKLADGEVTAAHADALANATSRLDDDTRRELYDHETDLASDATRMTPDEFGKSVRDLIRQLERDQGVERDRQQRNETRLTKTIDREGMYVLNARLHPELGHAVFNMLDAETAKLVKAGGDRSVDRAAIAAEALGNLVTGGHQAVRPHRSEVRVHVDATSLIDGPHADTVCEFDDGTPVPLPSVRRMLCNGVVVPIVIDTNGVVLDVGRDQRLANRDQRRALRAMYATCAFHGCDVAFNRCEIHHLHPWELGGSTDLDQLLPLCVRHHHVIHEPGWALHLSPERTLTIERMGEVYATVPLESERRRRSVEPEPPPGRRADRSAGQPAEQPPDPPSGVPHRQLPLSA